MTEHEYKQNFIKKHGKKDWRVETSAMDEYGKYVKTWLFEDGAQLIEINRPVWEKAQVEVKGITVTVDVKLFETECWNTDDATSYKWYQKY